MRILVIGHSVLDHIREPEGFRFQPGGIFYTATALSACHAPGDEFYLCTAIEEENYSIFATAFSAFHTEYCHKTARIPRVHLTITNEAERCERFENLNEKLQLPTGDLNHFDGILINMISGFELDSNDLAELRSRYRGPIYLDVHSLARGVGSQLVREFRLIPDFERWASHLTIIQCNESELETLGGQASQEEKIRAVLEAGAKILLVTRGENGADMYFLSNGVLNCTFQPPLVTRTVNKVGCGDVFGAFFFYYYIESSNAKLALQYASTAGGCVTTYNTLQQFDNLESDVRSFLS